jgi:hypothetical protein
MQAGLLPANALTYRLGYLEQAAEPVVREVRSLKDVFGRKAPIITETETFDPNRDARDLRGQSGREATDVSRLAFLVGPVHVKFGGDPAGIRVKDLAPYIDAGKKTVRTVTGQVELNWGVGLARVDAPKAQGVAGFLEEGGGAFDLSDVRIESKNDYAAIQVVSMDGQPLRESRKVLVQVGTIARLTGWRVREARVREKKQVYDGYVIEETGKPPYQIRNTQATVSIANGVLNRAVLLDVAGYPAKDVPVQRRAGRLVIDLPPNTLYLILTAQP